LPKYFNLIKEIIILFGEIIRQIISLSESIELLGERRRDVFGQ